ncbi:MAG: serine kinase [Rhodobacteraceae bacterium]|nr:serine kinase [Paracoccaceae bacterium]
MGGAGALVVHGTAVSLGGRALLILGPAGAGKSALALELLALGAGLIADDRTLLSLREGHPVASAPATIAGRIEARGLGILAATPAPPAPVVLAADLGRVETERLPPARHIDLLGVAIPLVHKVDGPHFPAALLQYLRGGRAG